MTYLPPDDRAAALAAHSDFYAQTDDVITPHVRAGKLHIGSLQCVGFGFGVEPKVDSFMPAEDWRYESLGIA